MADVVESVCESLGSKAVVCYRHVSLHQVAELDVDVEGPCLLVVPEQVVDPNQVAWAVVAASMTMSRISEEIDS